MPYYENVFIARQDASASQVESLAEQFTEPLTEAGGRVSRREHWGVRNLSYRIKKNRKGHYVLTNFEAPPEAVHEMERRMRISEDVLRYITVRVDDLPEQPSVVMQRRDERDRGGRGRDRDRGDRGGDRGDRGGRDSERGSRGGEQRGGEQKAGEQKSDETPKSEGAES